MTHTSAVLAGFMAERGLAVEELAYALEDEERGLTFEFAEAVILGVIAPETTGFANTLGQAYGLAFDEVLPLMEAMLQDVTPDR